jgi:glyoxylase-like metal-dependent hydrolase (beta-lactamase superfamily II)
MNLISGNGYPCHDQSDFLKKGGSYEKKNAQNNDLCLFGPGFFLCCTRSGQEADIKVYAVNAGVLKTQTQYMLKDTRVGTPMNIPVPFLVVKHGKEWIAFDTGCNANVAKDPIRYWGEVVVKAYTPVINSDQEFREAIRILGLKPGNFKAVIISHGHFDHAGAIDNFLGTAVPIYFQKAEMAEIRKIVEANLRVQLISWTISCFLKITLSVK